MDHATAESGARRSPKVLPMKTSAFVAVAVLVVSLGGIALSASPALAAGHTCTELGSYKGVEGVMCIDVITAPTEPFATAEVQVICEIGTQEEECAGATVFANAFNATEASYPAYAEGQCGHQYPACGTPRTYVYVYDMDIPIPQGTCADNVWAVLEKGSSIQLPGAADDYQVTLSGDLGTPHFNLCNPIMA